MLPTILGGLLSRLFLLADYAIHLSPSYNDVRFKGRICLVQSVGRSDGIDWPLEAVYGLSRVNFEGLKDLRD